MGVSSPHHYPFWRRVVVTLLVVEALFHYVQLLLLLFLLFFVVIPVVIGNRFDSDAQRYIKGHGLICDGRDFSRGDLFIVAHVPPVTGCHGSNLERLMSMSMNRP